MKTQNPKSRFVQHSHGTSLIGHSPDGLICLERSISARQFIEEIDASGPSWSIAIADLSPGQVSIKVGKRCHELSGKVAIYIPPFSVVRWNIQPGKLNFKAYIDDLTNLLPGFDQNLIIKTIDKIPSNPVRGELIKLFAQSGQQQTVSMQPSHVVVAKAKRIIDETYHSELSVSEIADLAHVNHAVMTRYFKNHFGIPPIVYRNRLRIFESMLLLMKESRAIANLAYDVGFESISQLNREFKKITDVSPRNFQI